MGLILANNASATIASFVNAAATTVTLTAGQGSVFPVLAAGDWHPMTLVNPDGSYEIVRVTGRNGDVLTMERAQEGTAAIFFQAGAAAGIRLTRAALEQFALSGQEDFTVLRGINYAVSTGTIGSSVYNANLNNISAYTQNLRLSILPHSANGSDTPTININSLGNVNIELPDGTTPHPGAILANRVMNLRYRLATNAFVLDNAISESEGLATETSAGLAQRGVEQDFNPTTGNNTKFTTQLTVSRIIEDSRPIIDTIPFMWSDKGTGQSAFNVVGSAALLAGANYDFSSLSIPAGAVLTIQGLGVCVIRCTGAIDIAGEIVFPRGRTLASQTHVGGAGSESVSGTRTVRRTFLKSGGQAEGQPLTVSQFFFNLRNGSPMNDFQGGIGGAANSQLNPQPGGGGIIFICTDFDIRASAQISNMHATPASPDGLLGASAGGMLVTISNSLDIEAGAEFEAGAQGSFDSRQVLAAQNASDVSQVANGANGNYFSFSLNSGSPNRVF